MEEQTWLDLVGITLISALMVAAIWAARRNYLRGYIQTAWWSPLRIYRKDNPKLYWSIYGLALLFFGYVCVLGLIAIYHLAIGAGGDR